MSTTTVDMYDDESECVYTYDYNKYDYTQIIGVLVLLLCCFGIVFGTIYTSYNMIKNDMYIQNIRYECNNLIKEYNITFDCMIENIVDSTESIDCYKSLKLNIYTYINKTYCC